MGNKVKYTEKQVAKLLMETISNNNFKMNNPCDNEQVKEFIGDDEFKRAAFEHIKAWVIENNEAEMNKLKKDVEKAIESMNKTSNKYIRKANSIECMLDNMVRADKEHMKEIEKLKDKVKIIIRILITTAISAGSLYPGASLKELLKVSKRTYKKSMFMKNCGNNGLLPYLDGKVKE